MSTEIRCLSVRQPWAWAICAGVKTIENRTWSTDRRGTIAIHASTSAQVVNSIRKSTGCESVHRDAFTFGAIIGFADIVDVSSYGPEHESNPFAEGPYCWTIEDGRFLRDPIPLKGKLNLFKTDVRVQEQMAIASTYTLDLNAVDSSRSIADAITGEPDPVLSYQELIDEFWRTQNHGGAIATAGERLIALAPDSDIGYIALGAMRLQNPDATDCSGLFRRAVELNPDPPLGWFFLSDAYLKEQQPEKAIEAADRLLKLSPDDPIVLTLLAESKAAAGDRSGALVNVKHARRLSPDNAMIAEVERQLLNQA